MRSGTRSRSGETARGDGVAAPSGTRRCEAMGRGWTIGLSLASSRVVEGTGGPAFSGTVSRRSSGGRGFSGLRSWLSMLLKYYFRVSSRRNSADEKVRGNSP